MTEFDKTCEEFRTAIQERHRLRHSGASALEIDMQTEVIRDIMRRMDALGARLHYETAA